MEFESIWTTIIAPIVVGLIVAVIGKFWVDSRIEKLKCSISERLFGHNLLFEKEMNIYQDLWGRLEKLRVSIAQMNWPFVPERPEDFKEGKLQDLIENFEIVNNAINKNKPFFAPEVYEEVQGIIRIAIGEMRAFHCPPVSQEDIVKRHKRAESTAQLVLNTTDKIEKAIRNRLFSAKS
jgi:hypothetical protein